MYTAEKYLWWNEAERKLADEVADFSDNVIRQQINEIERTKKFPWNWFEEMGRKGWYGAFIPEEYGGMGKGIGRTTGFCIVLEEIARGAPVAVDFYETTIYGYSPIVRFGTEKQKRKYLTEVAKGESCFCLGYSEPNSGSDLASIQTRAVEDGDSWVINGQKTWCSFAHYANYCWLGARTDPNVPKHKGISMFIIDMKTPGITVRPLINILNRHSFNEVFLDDVRVPKDTLIGEKNNGWYQLAMALDFERSLIGTAAANQRLIEELIQYVKEAKRSGNSPGDDPLIKDELAELVVENEVLRMMCYRIAWMCSKELHPSYESSMSLLFSSELLRRIANVGMRVLGHYGELDQDSKWAVFSARAMRTYLSCISIGVGGGTNEIQRNIVAMRGLGLPRQQ